MRLSCPACGFIADADAFVSERGTLEMLAAALSIPAQLAVPLLQYLRLFRPPNRALTSKRVSSLLAELVPCIKDAKIERHGRLWPAPVVTWYEAIEQLLAKRDTGKLTLPLRSHGYLLEVVAGIAGAAEARTEKRQEDALAGRTPVGATSPAHTPRQAPVAPRDKAAAARGLQSAKAVLRNVVIPGDGDAH